MSEKGDLTGNTAWPLERRCPECGRVFCLSAVEVWGFRDRETLMCSWGCLRRREERNRQRAEAAARKKAKKKKLKPTQKEGVIRRYLLKGLSNEEISAETGFSVQLVNYYRRKIWKELEK